MIIIVGVGVLGSRVAKSLSNREHVLLIDHDIVQPENIGRQYPAECLGMRKVDACRLVFHKDAETVWKHIDLTTVALLSEASLVIDCTDNFVTRFVINDYCTREGIPWIHTALSDRAGTVASFVPGGPCLRCVYDTDKGETCTPNLDLALADKVASVVKQELTKIHFAPKTTQFIHVTSNAVLPLHMDKQSNCRCCKGHYDFLDHERGFYITYCVNSHCMAAKPVKPHGKDHGHAREIIVDGVAASIFPNGEIHFHKELDADILHALATRIYAAHDKTKNI